MRYSEIYCIVKTIQGRVHEHRASEHASDVWTLSDLFFSPLFFWSCFIPSFAIQPPHILFDAMMTGDRDGAHMERQCEGKNHNASEFAQNRPFSAHRNFRNYLSSGEVLFFIITTTVKKKQ